MTITEKIRAVAEKFGLKSPWYSHVADFGNNLLFYRPKDEVKPDMLILFIAYVEASAANRGWYIDWFAIDTFRYHKWTKEDHEGYWEETEWFTCDQTDRNSVATAKLNALFEIATAGEGG